MDDIICTVPEACGEKDCPVGWHLTHYWAYDDGCEAGDVPTAEQEHAAWLDYSRYVAATGCDPLGEFNVPRTTKRKERYTAAFRLSILGAALVAVRRGGKVVPLRDLPQRVVDYLCVERLNGAAGNLRFTDGWQALLAIPEVKMYRGTARVTFTLDHEESRAEAAVEADLRRAARRHLRESKAKK